MTRYVAYFNLHIGGVQVALILAHESKHHPLSTLDAACEYLATKLDATFMYYERIPT